MIVQQLPTMTLELDQIEADEAFRLMHLVNDLGDEACGSPAHNQALDEFGVFVGRVARDNLARGDVNHWTWSPTWQLTPPPPPQEMSLWQMLVLIVKTWEPRWKKPTARPPQPERAEVVPIRRK